MEKKRAHYDLKRFKAAFAGIDGLNMTGSALTSDLGTKVWQDVYNIPYGGQALYVKLTMDAKGDPLIISFKEK